MSNDRPDDPTEIPGDDDPQGEEMSRSWISIAGVSIVMLLGLVIVLMALSGILDVMTVVVALLMVGVAFAAFHRFTSTM